MASACKTITNSCTSYYRQGRSKWFFGVFRASVRDLAARVGTGRARAALIAGGRTKTRQETTAIMPEINTSTTSVTTASKDVISDVVRYISMRPGRHLVMGLLYVNIVTNIRNYRLLIYVLLCDVLMHKAQTAFYECNVSYKCCVNSCQNTNNCTTCMFR